jgi:uncharacterized membrane protein YgcG
MLRMRLAALALLVGVASAWAVFPPDIKDDGKFFKADAVKAANKKIRELYEKYKKDVVVETYSTLPAEARKLLDGVKGDDREPVFAKIAAGRSQALGVDGVYILISRTPRILRIHASPEVEKKAFTVEHQKALREKILAKFKGEDFDGGLAAATEYLAETLEKASK